ncbi:MAG: hypothetical protein I8H71_00825 [Xanthomonadaceae bacterium]|nr:hypothetical protein [Xanthomonadaceae bacterium]
MDIDNASPSLAQWRPVYWEPVAGSGERLMAGVVGIHGDNWQARRVLRDDVLESLYGERASGAMKLIDEALSTALVVAKGAGLEALRSPVMGLSPGALRRTAAANFSEVLKQAALLYSSLTNLDALDNAEDEPSAKVEDGNRQFGAEVRSTIAALRPDLKEHLSRKAPVAEGGVPVRFGFLSDRLIVQFAVLHPVRQSGSVSTARGKIFELQQASLLSGIPASALVLAVPPADAAVFHENQRNALRANTEEIRREAKGVGVNLEAVTTVLDGANRVLQLQG